MLEATREAIGFARERRRTDLDCDRMLLLSLVKALEMIGEAASKVTVDTRNSFLEIPWSEIVAMRTDSSTSTSISMPTSSGRQ